ncbi:MAG: ATP-binding protein [Solirubrobacteraceae bacterium]
MLTVLEAHPNAQTLLEPTLAADGSPSHAYLFHGPGGAGKRDAARQIAAAWLASGAPDPASAHARALAGVHPDLTWVTPSGAHEILVSDIDEPVVAAASRTPFEATRRVFVIESADQLGAQAANRLLKTLEEPAAFVHLILVTDHLADVLETIRSRCQTVRFEGPSVEAIAAELRLRGVDGPSAQACARLGLGDADRSRQLASAQGAQLREQAVALVRHTLDPQYRGEGGWEGLLAAVKARGEELRATLDERRVADLELVSSRDRKRVEADWEERIRRGRRRAETTALALGLDVVESWLLDLLALRYDAPELVRNRDRRDDLDADIKHLSGEPGRLLAAVEIVEQTRQRLTRNVSEDLAMEAMTYRLGDQLAGR